MSAPKQRVSKNKGNGKYDDDGACHVHHHHHHYHRHYHIHHHYKEEEKVETITTEEVEEEEESDSNDFSKHYHNPPVEYNTPAKRQKGDNLSSMEFMSPWVLSPFDQEFLAEERRQNSLAAAELEREKERKTVEEHWRNCNYDGAQPRDDFDFESSNQPAPIEAATFIEDDNLPRTPVKETKITEVEANAVAVQVNIAQNEKKPNPNAEKEEEEDEEDTANTQYYYNMFLIQSTNKE